MAENTIDNNWRIEVAKKRIAEYFAYEFNIWFLEGDEFDDVRDVALGYTTDGTGEHTFEMRGDLVDSVIRYFIDGEVKGMEIVNFTEDLCGWYEMSNSFFEHMVGKCEELLEKESEKERVRENC